MTENIKSPEEPEVDQDKRYRIMQAAQQVAQGAISRDDLVAMQQESKEWDERDVSLLDNVLPEVQKNVDYHSQISQSAYTSVIEEESNPTFASDFVNAMEKDEGWGEKEQRVFYGERERYKRQLRSQLEDADVSKEYAKRLEEKLPISRDIALGIDMGRRGLYSLAVRPFSYDKATKIIEGSETMDRAAMIADESSPLGSLGKHVRGASRSIFQAAALSPLGAYGMIGGFALTRGNQAITEADNNGLTGTDKWGYIGRAAAIEGGIAGAFQLVGLGGFEKFATGGITATTLRSFLTQAGIQMAAELTEENITEMLDQVNQTTTLPEYQNLSSAERNKMLYDTVLDTTIQTVLTMGVTTGFQGLKMVQDKKGLDRLKKTLVADKMSPEAATKAIETAMKKQEGKDTFEEALGREIDKEKMKTKEGVALWATNNTDKAVELANSEKPTREQFDEIGKLASGERAEFVKNVRSFLDNTGIDWQKATEPPQEAVTAPPEQEQEIKAPEVVEETKPVKEAKKSLPIAADLRNSLGIKEDVAVGDLKLADINQLADEFGIEANDVIEVLSEEKGQKGEFEGTQAEDIEDVLVDRYDNWIKDSLDWSTAKQMSEDSRETSEDRTKFKDKMTDIEKRVDKADLEAYWNTLDAENKASLKEHNKIMKGIKADAIKTVKDEKMVDSVLKIFELGETKSEVGAILSAKHLKTNLQSKSNIESAQNVVGKAIAKERYGTLPGEYDLLFSPRSGLTNEQQADFKKEIADKTKKILSSIKKGLSGVFESETKQIKPSKPKTGKVKSVMDTPVSLAQKKTIDGVEYNLYREKDGKSGIIETVDVDTGNTIQSRKYKTFDQAMDAHQETIDAAAPKAEQAEKQKVSQPEMFAGPLFEQQQEQKPKVGKKKVKKPMEASLDLGTIIPTKEDMAKADKHADKMEAQREQIAEKELSQYDKKVIDGEDRYYKNAKQYAIVGRNNEIKWFEHRGDDVFAIKTPETKPKIGKVKAKKPHEMTRGEFKKWIGKKKQYQKIGNWVKKRSGAKNLDELGKHYTKKYGMEKVPIEIEEVRMTPQDLARDLGFKPKGKEGVMGNHKFSFNVDLKTGNHSIQVASLDFNGKPRSTEFMFGIARHEIEHAIDKFHGFKSKHNEQSPQTAAGHFEYYKDFSVDYIRRAMVKDALKSGIDVSDAIIDETSALKVRSFFNDEGMFVDRVPKPNLKIPVQKEAKPKIGKKKVVKKEKQLGSLDKKELRDNTLTGRILIDEGQFNAKSLKNVGFDPEVVSESMFRPTQAFGHQMKVVVDQGGIGDIDLWAQQFHDSLVSEGVIGKMETADGKVDTEKFLDWVFDTLGTEKTELDQGRIPKTLADPSERAEMAALEAGRSINDYIEDFNTAPGFTIKKVGKTTSDDVVIPGSMSKEVEARWQEAKGIKSPGKLKKVAEILSDAKKATRHWTELDPKNPLDANVGNVLRLFQNVQNYTKGLAENALKGVTAGMGKKKYEIYTRNIILADLADDVASGLHDNKDLPFGYKNEAELKADLKMFNDIANANPDIRQAIEKRNSFMNTLKQELVDNALLPKEVLDKNNYFHHQVLEYRNMSNKMKVGEKGLEQTKRGWQRKRIGSFKDYNTEYIQAEFEVVADMLAKIEATKTLKRLKAMTNISGDLKALAKEKGVKYKELIPDGYTAWKPKSGLRLYLANSFSENVLQEVLQGERQLEDEDVKKILAVGTAEEWIIPTNIADTFNSLKEFQKGDLMERLAKSTLNSWKQWVLLNPYRVTKYNINNMSGDADIAMAYDPRIAIQHGWGAMKESYKYWRGKGLTKRMSDALKLNVIDSGFAGSEIESISKAGFFKLLTGENPNLVEKYWNSVKGFTQFRENILRLAAFNYFTSQRKKGKTNMYGASNPAEIDAMQDGLEKDAKLARELIGDYGNISKAGEYIRGHLVPFWSFQEINAKRYMRLMANLGKEGRKTGGAYKSFKIAKTTASVSWKAGKLAIFANLLSGMVQMWNHAFFPDEEDELDDRYKREGHIILGRREDGSIRSLRFKGALTEALEWFGAQDYISDIGDVMKGEATVWDKIAEIPKSAAIKGLASLRPEPKLLYESLTKKSLWPDPMKPSPVRDVAEHILKTISLGRLYRRVTGKPMRGLSDEMQSLVFYNTDPGEAAHWDIKNKTFKFLEKKGKDRPSGDPTERSNAVYYFKQALRYNDEKAAEKWYDRYIELGGTKKGLGTSMKRSSPLGSLPNDLYDEFKDSLSKKDLEELKFAEEWYAKKGKQVKSEKIGEALTAIEGKKISSAVYDLTDPSGSKSEKRMKEIIEGKTLAELESALRREYKDRNKPRIKKASNGKYKIGSGFAIYKTKESAEEAREKQPRKVYKFTKSRKLSSFGKRLNKLKEMVDEK